MVWGIDTIAHVVDERGDAEVRECGECLNINSWNYKHGEYRNYTADVWMGITMNTIICFDRDFQDEEIFESWKSRSHISITSA